MSEYKFDLLSEILTDKTTILIHPHNYPDPDAIAASVALKILLKTVFSLIYYYHVIAIVKKSTEQRLGDKGIPER